MCNFFFLNTQLTFAVTLNVKEIAKTMSIFNIKLKSAKTFTKMFNLNYEY